MKSYFNFNRKEKLGVVVFAGIILGLTVLLNVGYTHHIPDPFIINEQSLEFVSSNNSATYQDYENAQSGNGAHNELTPFDPNEIGIEQWKKMGFSEKQAASIVNYRQNYGPFYKKEDLKKLYVISAEKYAELEPYIQIKIEQKQQFEPNMASSPNQSTALSQPLDINNATKDELMAISGIGSTFADRIMAYREKIGGLVDLEQINEIYISDEAKTILKEKSVINTSNLRKLNPNSASKDQLRNIPYSNWAVVAAILKYRDSHTITNLDFLTNEINPDNKAKFGLYLDL